MKQINCFKLQMIQNENKFLNTINLMKVLSEIFKMKNLLKKLLNTFTENSKETNKYS